MPFDVEERKKRRRLGWLKKCVEPQLDLRAATYPADDRDMLEALFEQDDHPVRGVSKVPENPDVHPVGVSLW